EASRIDRSAHGLFPLDGAGRFAGYVVANSIDATNFVDDSRRNARQNFVWNPYPVSRHSIMTLHDPERHGVLVGALIAHHPHRSNRTKNSERLPEFIVPVGRFHFAYDDFVRLSQDRKAFLRDIAEDSHRETGTRKRLAKYDFARQLKLETHLPNLILEKMTERFEQLKIHRFRQSADIVMALDEGGRISRDGNALNNIRIKCSLCQKTVASLTGILGLKLFCSLFEDAYELGPNKLPLFFRVGDTLQQGEKAI